VFLFSSIEIRHRNIKSSIFLNLKITQYCIVNKLLLQLFIIHFLVLTDNKISVCVGILLEKNTACTKM